ncbi:MAG TPA: M20/M25/M40 family metallo-hydrolase [Planctomycetota bacterium]|jgi:hypothetical protein|nr:M20/M25/M40 family metallo-hydrolase [Planctomycetota bacterium]
MLGALLALLLLPGDVPPISAADLFAHVEFLADDALEGRRSGTPGADRAARYVATRFQASGLEPAGEGGGWFQEFEVPLEERAGESSSVAFKVGNRPVAPLPGRVLPLPLSGSEAVEGEVVFAGYGIRDPDSGYDDYEGLDVQGRVVLVLRYGPGMKGPRGAGEPFRGAALSEKVEEAKHHGAAGLLLCNGWSPASPPDDALVAFRGGGADAGVAALQISNDAAGTLAAAAGFDLRGAQSAIDAERKPRSAPLAGVRVALRADVLRPKGKARNVLGLLRGTDPSAGTVVVGAHYDHLGRGGEDSRAPEATGQVHNGADDNASGTAALLEIARALASQERPVRSVLFAGFSGEEEGLLGSRRLVENPPVAAARIVAMLNLDMVGRSREGSLDVSGVGTSPRWKAAIEEGEGDLGLKPRLSEPGHGFGGSDHLSFLQKEIPALFFFTGLHDDYHRPSDDAEKVNAGDAARIALLAARIARAIASSAEPVPFTKTEGPSPTTQAGPARSWLGTMPDYAESGKGMRLSGVSAGSPAEKAGLLRGDLLTRVGEVKVANVYDLMYALGKYRPGEEVEVDFERDGKPTTVKVTLARRAGGS